MSKSDFVRSKPTRTAREVVALVAGKTRLPTAASEPQDIREPEVAASEQDAPPDSRPIS